MAFLVLGRRVWPGIALGALLVNAPISASPAAAAATAAGNTLAPFVAAELLRRVGFRREVDRLRDAIAIVFLGALSSMLISATVGAGTLLVSGAISAGEFPGAWAVWWTGDAMGVLVVAPFLLTLLPLRRRSKGSWKRRAEAGGLFVLLTLVSVAVVRTHFDLLFLVLPLLGWAAWRFQQRGAAPAALLVAGIASWAAARGRGPFEGGRLLSRMLTLQAFNATVAFTSFVFAALVSERMRAREALEQAAAGLEVRVRERTSALSTANERLTREIGVRREVEGKLRERERQLAEAQQVALIGSWEWLIPEDRVTWSDEMYRIHGHEPQAFPLDLAKAVEQVLGDDVERIRRNTEAALRSGRNRNLPSIEYRIVRTDLAERVLVGKARLTVGPTGEPVRMVGTVQDITEERLAEREHRIAATLQRSLLPDRLPEIPGVALAGRYVPATTGLEVGGDWYDVLQLPNGHVGVGIGDVAGHGLRAASTMGQLRMALRAYALEEESPARVVIRLHQLVQKLPISEMATLVYLVFDPDAGSVTYANAGHPPPLVIPADGDPSYLEDGRAPPLGAAPAPDLYTESVFQLANRSTLLLFTDGLVERRGVSLREGLERLRNEAQAVGPELDLLCDHLLGSFLGKEASDDVALIALRPMSFTGEPLHLRLEAEPRALAPMRHTLRRWLRSVEADPGEAYEIVLACGEACANAIQHPYGVGEGVVEIDMDLVGREVRVRVRDVGRWRLPARRDGGRGLQLMRGFMDSVEVETGAEGTEVRMRRRLRAPAR